jgi:UDP:flavonoid glycosyltransferase YjiC (YdhE family)
LAGFLSLDDAVARFGTTAAPGGSSTAANDSVNSSSSNGSDSDGKSWASLLSDPKSNSSSISSSSDWQPSEELLQFLDAGSPPIYIGFGSMVVQDPQQLVQLVLQAAAALPAGQRVILCTGWSGAAGTAATAAAANIGTADAGGDGSSSSSSRVLCISEAPHEWLFPRLALR